MIELHMHLDGSLGTHEIKELAEISGVTLDCRNEQEFKSRLTVSENCRNLAEYLQKFTLPISVLQTAESIKKAVEMLLLRLKSEGIIYAEIRFAPQLHLQKGLTQEEVIKAAISGLTVAGGAKAQLILCCMRGADYKLNFESAKLAAKFLNSGVCALDLAGNEAAFKTEDYITLFEFAKSGNIPLTVHAGEAAGAKSVACALQNGAARIGHGVSAAENPQVLELMQKLGTTVECCFTSNLQTCAVDNPKHHPIKDFLNAHVNACVCTDNTSVSGTTLKNEYRLVKSHLQLNEAKLLSLCLNAAEGAFLPQNEKQKLKKYVRNEFFSWFNK